MNIKIPLSIDKCPINESVLEIRFKSNFPDDAIYGALYPILNSMEEIELPILQIPKLIRAKDLNFKYQPYYKYKTTKNNYSLSFGPRVLIFSNTEYTNWKSWSEFFIPILEKIKEINIIESVERVGLRYINLFQLNIFDRIKFSIKLNETLMSNEKVNFLTETSDDNFTKVLKLSNSVHINGSKDLYSIIDIDCIYMFKNDDEPFFKQYKKLINIAHEKEKEQFFTLLNNDFIEELSPIYSE